VELSIKARARTLTRIQFQEINPSIN
jgi:hypothetical protein